MRILRPCKLSRQLRVWFYNPRPTSYIKLRAYQNHVLSKKTTRQSERETIFSSQGQKHAQHRNIPTTHGYRVVRQLKSKHFGAICLQLVLSYGVLTSTINPLGTCWEPKWQSLCPQIIALQRDAASPDQNDTSRPHLHVDVYKLFRL
jgi:hypothetical protein